MAPELWSEHEKEYDSSVDMWAIGVVTYMLLSGKRPFHHQDRERKAMMIKHDKLSFHSQANLRPGSQLPSPHTA
jgi:serine/threonine protein kinase